jgi:hypothetical protein
MMFLAYILIMNYIGPTFFLLDAIMSRSWANVIGFTSSNPTAPSLLEYSKWMFSKRLPHQNSVIPSRGATEIIVHQQHHSQWSVWMNFLKSLYFRTVQVQRNSESCIPYRAERMNALNTQRAYQPQCRLPAQQMCWRSSLAITATWKMGGQPFKCRIRR